MGDRKIFIYQPVLLLMFEHIDGCVQPGNPRLRLDPSIGIDAKKGDFSADTVQNGKNRLVGVIGLGSVGKALRVVMSYFYEVAGYDIIGEYDWGPILSCEAVFVCVQTPESFDGRLDCSHVSDVLGRLSQDQYGGIVVIKSTLGIGYMGTVTEKYPDLNLVYSPEFMSEKNAFAWTADPDRIVLSGKDEHLDYVESLYSWVDKARIIRTDYQSAEIGKLAHNAYIAVKVTFTNTMESIAESQGANAADVMRIVYSDRRVGSSAHLEPHKGPYGGKCVPKDTSELINAFGEQAKLLKVADEVNDTLTEARSKTQTISRKHNRVR
jgi:UDPglucose 6-dehydrogenase